MMGLDLLGGTVKSEMLMEGDCSPSSVRSAPIGYTVDEVAAIWSSSDCAGNQKVSHSADFVEGKIKNKPSKACVSEHKNNAPVIEQGE